MEKGYRKDHRPSGTAAVAVAGLLALVLIGQAASGALAPAHASEAGTRRSVERAGFAYLTGIRTYAAAVLWNRIDPIYHDYYEEMPLHEQTYMMPTIRAVVALDPQFLDAYYVAAWVLGRRGDVAEGVELARLGVENNPDSGLMRANYAQILWVLDDDLEGATHQVKAALGEDVVWRNLVEQFESYAVIRDVLSAAGDEDLAESVRGEMLWIDEEIDRLGITIGHDH